MGWGSIVKEVYIGRVYKKDIHWKLEETNEYIDSLEKELTALVASTPREETSDDGEKVSWLWYTSVELKRINSELREAYNEVYLYEIALENMEDVIDY